MDDLISVIVPVFNSYEYLRNCIESILNQTYKKIELILVDDGSDDGSSEICDSYKNKDKRVVVIHKKKNEGASEARNTGIKHVKGSYIMFVDNDDYININIIEILLSKIKKYNADISICNYKKVYEYKDFLCREKSDKAEEKIYTGRDAVSQIYSDKRVEFTVIWNKLYKKELIINEKFFGIHEDERFTYRILYKAKKIVYIESQLYYYMYRKGSISRNMSLKNYKCIGNMLEERVEFFKDKGEIELLKETEYLILNNIINQYFLEDKNTRKELFEKYKRNLKINEKEMKEHKKIFSKKRHLRLRMFYFNPLLYIKFANFLALLGYKNFIP